MQGRFNLYFYLGFIVLGLYNLLVNRDYAQLAALWGIAFLFDPFDINQSWKERPVWQRAVLIVQLFVVLVAVLLDFFPSWVTSVMHPLGF